MVQPGSLRQAAFLNQPIAPHFLAVDIRPAQHTFSMLKGNTLRLQTMDVDSVRVVATALAQVRANAHDRCP